MFERQESVVALFCLDVTEMVVVWAEVSRNHEELFCLSARLATGLRPVTVDQSQSLHTLSS